MRKVALSDYHWKIPKRLMKVFISFISFLSMQLFNCNIQPPCKCNEIYVRRFKCFTQKFIFSSLLFHLNQCLKVAFKSFVSFGVFM